MKNIHKILLTNILLVSSIFAVGCGETVSTPSVLNPSTDNPSYDGDSSFLDEDFANLDGWKLENADFERNSDHSTFSIKDSTKKIVLSINHLATRKDRNYKISLSAKGDAKLNIKLLNNNSFDIIRGINTEIDLSN